MAAQTSYWLVKSEPDQFSWNQQLANGVEPWTGVRNFSARNHLRAMQLGDLAFFYHSQIGKAIVGVVEVARAAYPDPTADKGDWSAVDLRALSPFPRPVTLAAIKADARFNALALVRLSRLSVSPVSVEHWRALCALGGWKRPLRSSVS